MKTVLFIIAACGPLLAVAQPSHWRYSLAIGRAKPFTHLTTAKPILDERLQVSSPVGIPLQAALERSISKNVSVRASIGRIPISYTTNSTLIVRDSIGQPRFWVGGGGGSGSTNLTVGTLGVTLNSRTYGRTIFTAGLDGVIRVNGQADQAGRKSGGSSSGYTIIRGDTQRYEVKYPFISEQIRPVTFGLAARLGLDYRLSKRGLFRLEVSYTKGFGYVKNMASNDLLVDGVPNTGRYISRASNVAVHVGYTHSLFRVNPLDRLQFTPYNQFEVPPRFITTEQRLTTFRAKAMLYELRGSYLPLTGLTIAGAGGSWGYFFANRQMVGLSVDYQRYNDSYSSRAVGSLVQVGPIFRTYATRQRLSPYLEGGYQIGRFTSGLLSSRFVSSIPVTMGMSVRVNQSVRLNLSYATRFVKQNGRFRATQSIPQISLSYVPIKSTGNAQ